MQPKMFIRPAIVTLVILLIPLVAMRVTSDVAWSPMDFVIAGSILFATGFAYELLATRAPGVWQKVILAAGLVAMLLLVWAQLAVGII